MDTYITVSGLVDGWWISVVDGDVWGKGGVVVNMFYVVFTTKIWKQRKRKRNKWT